MPRVLFIHTSSILGGSEKAFLDLINQYPKRDAVDVFFILPSHGPLEKRLIEIFGRSERIAVIEWPSKFNQTSRKFPIRSLFWTMLSLPDLIKYLLKIQRVITDQKIQVIYSNGIKCHIITGFLKRFSRAKVIWHLQDFFPHISFVDLFLKYFAKQPDLVIANSKSVLDDFHEHSPAGWAPASQVIHNSVNPLEFLPSEKPFKKPIVVSLVAMLTPWKGQDIFIEAMSIVRSKLSAGEVQGWIVGEEVYSTAGEQGYAKNLTDLISKRNLSDTVIMKGLIADVQAVYNSSDIVVHCSVKPEPFGRVIVEAMSCECAVIASRAGGVLEIIESEKDGILVEPGSPNELAKAILRLVSDAPLRERLGREARQTVIRKFNSTHFAESIISEIQAFQ